MYRLRMAETGRSISALRPRLTPLCPSALCALARAEDAQPRGQALLERARQRSDIRAPNSPAFRLRATFSSVGKDLATVQGSYCLAMLMVSAEYPTERANPAAETQV
jgi:hypothetical protein